MYRIWLERPLPPRHEHLIAGVATVAGVSTATPAAPFEALPGSHAVIAGGRLRYDAAMMDLVPTLRVICRSGIGYDNVAVAEATARGIAVCNAPEAPTISTAEHAIALLMAVARDFKRTEAAARRGSQVDYFGDYRGLELFGLRLGLVGLGRIGSRVARVARALEMAVAAFDPWVTPAHAAELGIELVPTLEELLASADVVSLHLPLTLETHHLIDAERLARMKRGVILINTARGGLVDEKALLAALESGHVRGAGLDVFESEPPAPDHPLLHRDDVAFTPHVAAGTAASKDRLWVAALRQAVMVLQGERPPHLVNPEAWPPPVRPGHR
jgi:D-3-phosphoglycerate dehydrogenase